MATTPTPLDYIKMFRRRRAFFLVPFAILLGASVALATLLPSVYQSTATIRIDKQHIPADLIETTVVTGYIDEYLEVLSQKALSNKNLWEIAKELDLFPELRDESSKHAVGARMRQNTSRDTVYVEVGPDQERRSDSVAVAFTVSYMAQDGETAHQVANALADLYLVESQRIRTQQATRLADFLREESKRLAARLAELEQGLARFKEQHVAKLPDFMDLNMQMMETTQDELDRLNETISGLRQQKIQLQGELAQIDPQAGVLNAERQALTPAQQVERLRLDYMDLSTRYTPNHPDLARLRNQLAALEGQTPKAAKVFELVADLEQSRAELINAKEKYTDQHPDVAKLKRTTAELKTQLSALGSGALDAGGAADNPAYIGIKSRLEGIEAQLQAEQRKRDVVERRLEEFDSRLLSSPAVEERYRLLMRDYQSVLREYRETRDKQLKAEVAEKVERTQMGDRFELYSPASRPDEPAQPKRAGIALLGFIFATGAGTGFAVLAEYFDRTVRGLRGVLETFGGPPIAMVPVILNKAERRRRMRRLIAIWVVVVAIATAFLVLGLNANG